MILLAMRSGAQRVLDIFLPPLIYQYKHLVETNGNNDTTIIIGMMITSSDSTKGKVLQLIQSHLTNRYNHVMMQCLVRQ